MYILDIEISSFIGSLDENSQQTRCTESSIKGLVWPAMFIAKQLVSCRQPLIFEQGCFHLISGLIVSCDLTKSPSHRGQILAPNIGGMKSMQHCFFFVCGYGTNEPHITLSSFPSFKRKQCWVMYFFTKIFVSGEHVFDNTVSHGYHDAYWLNGQIWCRDLFQKEIQYLIHYIPFNTVLYCFDYWK